MWVSMYIWEPGKVVPIYNPSTQKLKQTEDHEFEASLEYTRRLYISK